MGDNEKARRVTLIGVVATVILFVIKLIAAIVSGSLAVISDTLNSFLDLFSYSAVHLTVKMSYKRPDREHPFGHRRAQPIAGIIIAILAGILGFEIIREAILNMLGAQADKTFGLVPIVALSIVIGTKILMAFYFRKRSIELSSPAVKAAYIDSRNDILASSIALIAVIAGNTGIGYVDDIAAILIGVYIFYSGFEVGEENVGYLTGKRAPDELMNKVKAKVGNIPGVESIHNVRAHYVGDVIEVEAHLKVSEKMTIRKAHAISEEAKRRVESMPEVSRAFIHIDVG